MPGLLDWFNDPQTQGMLGLSAGLLQAGGPNTRRTGIGQGLSQGLLMGSNLANDARKGQLMGLQGQSMQTQLEAQKRAQAAIDALAQQIPEADKARFLADPAGYLKVQNEGYTLSPDQTRMQGGRVVGQGTQSVTYQDAGAFLIPVNKQGQQVGPAVPKGVTPDAQANLGQRQHEFGNLSRYQGAQLGNDAARLGIDRQRLGFEGQRLGLEGINTYYNTGMGLPGAGGGGMPATPPFVGAPSAAAPAAGMPGLPPNLPPKLRNELALIGPKAAATAAGEAAGKREVNMAGITNTIAEAEAVLKGQAGKTDGLKRGGSATPTGSILGAGVDFALSGVGIATEGAEQADRMKALAANLTMKMPRMEGPQSDKDTQAYREAAGQIGDNMIPVSRRIAALETVKNLYSKYDKSAGVRVVDW